MRRRDFLKTSVAATGLCVLNNALPGRIQYAQTIMTVRGPISSEQMGLTLPHEHILVDFIGAGEIHPERYDADEVFDIALPHVQRLRELGGQTLIECTPAYLGRDPRLLHRLSTASGIHILTNTGYYGARNDQYLPSQAFSESADQLAARWIQDWEDGIEDTRIKPGFIKIGVDGGPLSANHKKLIQAAARTHLRSGLTIAAHTGPAEGALDQLAVLEREGVAPSAWIWVHAQGENDLAHHLEVGRRGAWVEFDGLGPGQVDKHVRLVTMMKEQGLLHRVLLSHDAGWYHVGEPAGGSFRPYDTLFTEFLPALRKTGFTEAEIQQVIIDNPAEAFAVRIRAL